MIANWLIRALPRVRDLNSYDECAPTMSNKADAGKRATMRWRTPTDSNMSRHPLVVLGTWKGGGFSPCAMFPIPPFEGLFALVESEAEKRRAGDIEKVRHPLLGSDILSDSVGSSVL